MKLTVINLIVLMLICFSSCTERAVVKNQENNNNHDPENVQKMNKLRHLVLFKFKESATSEEIIKVEKAFADLPSKIEQIDHFEWGINVSPENLSKGFTHGFLLTFSSERDRDIYLPHPDHKAFGKIIEPFLEDVLVIDYLTN